MQALLAAVRLKAVKASHWKAIRQPASKDESISNGQRLYKTPSTAGLCGSNSSVRPGSCPWSLWDKQGCSKVHVFLRIRSQSMFSSLDSLSAWRESWLSSIALTFSDQTQEGGGSVFSPLIIKNSFWVSPERITLHCKCWITSMFT